MKMINAINARNDLYNLIDETIISSEPIQIIGKRGNAVLISEEDWRAIQETLYLISIPGLKEDIIEGMNASEDELFDLEDIGWNIQ